MSMDRHDVIAERLEEYALGQLSADERRAVDAHVGACPACAARLRDLSGVLELLAQAADPVTPSAGLRQRVLNAVAAEPQEPAPPGVREAAPFERAPSRWGRAWLATAAALIVVVGAWLYLAESSRQRAVEEAVRATAQAASLQQRLGEIATQSDLAVSILTAADMREIPIAGRDNATAAAARAYWSAERGLLLVADRLPVPPPGRIYQVWLIADGQPVSAGLLSDETAGRGLLIVPPPRPGVAGAVTVAVTDEPPGGLPAPSGVIRLVGSI